MIFKDALGGVRADPALDPTDSSDTAGLQGARPRKSLAQACRACCPGDSCDGQKAPQNPKPLAIQSAAKNREKVTLGVDPQGRKM